MKKMIISGFVAALMFVSACDSSTTRAIELSIDQDDGSGQMIHGRTLVTSDFMRLDGGFDDDKYYILFDRKNKIIYSVNGEDRVIVKIVNKDVDVESPIPLNWEEHVTENHDFEQKNFMDKPVKQYTITVDEQLCFIAYFTDEFLPEAAKAEQEYLSVVAQDNKRILPQTPADMIEACDLVINSFYPGSHLKYGYPIGVTNGKSYRRVMKSYDESAKVNKSLFVLPEGFEILTPEMIMPLVGS